MLARLVFKVVVLVVLAQSTSWAQTQLDQNGEIRVTKNSYLAFEPIENLPNSTFENRVTKTSYLAQEADQNQAEDTVADLEEKLKKMELRLRELEVDVEDNLSAQPEKEKKQEASDEEFGERLGKLEEAIEEQGEAVGDLEDTLPGMVYHSHKKPKLQLFGRIHLDYWSFPNTDETLFPLEGGNPQDRFGFRRLRVGVKGNINDNMFYKYEGEFADGVEPSYRDAYLGFSELPRLQTLIIGNQKRPYGLDHLNSSRYNVFLERPFMVEAFNQDSRRLGICSYGVSDDLKRNWRFGVYNQQLTQTRFGYIGDHYQLELAGRLALTPWYDESSGGRGYLHLGFSGSVGVPDGRDGSTNNQADYRTRPESRTTMRWLDTGAISGANGNYLMGLESVFNVGPFQFVGEYMRVNVDRRDLVGEDVDFDGVYVQAAYMLTGEHMPWDRKSSTLARIKPFENFFMVRDCDCNVQRGLGAWQIAARYSHADLTDFDIIGGEGDSFTFGLNWYWNPYARMQFNYIYGDIDREPEGFGNYNVFGVRFMVDF